MAIVIDPAAAQAAGTRLLLREMDKNNELAIDDLCKRTGQLLREVSDDAPNGWKADLDNFVAALKTGVALRKDIKEAIQALP